MSDRDLHVIYALAGNGSTGDDLIQDGWIRYLSDEAPDTRIILHSPSSGLLPYYLDRRNVLVDPFLPSLDARGGRAAAAGRAGRAGVAELLARGEAAAGMILDRYPEWRRLLERVRVFHVAGGDDGSDRLPQIVRYVGLVAALGRTLGTPVVATGFGLTPREDEADALRSVLSGFTTLDVRDSESLAAAAALGLGNASVSCDDTFIAAVRAAPRRPGGKGRLFVNIQSDGGLDARHDALVGAMSTLVADARQAGRQAVYVSFADRSDRVFWRRLAGAGVRLPLLTHADLLRDGLPFGPEDICITSRYHCHLLAARLGARGLVVEAADGPDAATHRPLAGLGTNWPGFFERLEASGAVDLGALDAPAIDEAALVALKRQVAGTHLIAPAALPSAAASAAPRSASAPAGRLASPASPPPPAPPVVSRRGKIGVLVRTHYFDRSIELLHEKWSRILPGAVGILMDDTRGPIDTGDLPKVSFDLAALEARGLPNLPPGRAAWHCGDYVMAAVEPHMDEDDFVFVVENDAVPGIADAQRWRQILAEIATHDLAATRYGSRGRNWSWRKGVDNVYGGGPIYGALIIALGFTRATARLMTERRIEIGEARRREGFEDWPFCELFVGMEAHRANLRVANLKTWFPDIDTTLSTSSPYWFDAVIGEDATDTIYHPAVVSREKYLAKIVTLIRNRNRPELIEEKLASLGRLTPPERRRLAAVRRRMEALQAAAT
jgi:polysaccharide pyruvyl transferase WcaK-like protein